MKQGLGPSKLKGVCRRKHEQVTGVGRMKAIFTGVFYGFNFTWKI